MTIELLTQDDVAALLHKRRRTLEDWRYRGVGPRFVMVGRSVLYRPEDVASWIASRVVASTTEGSVKLKARRPQR